MDMDSFLVFRTFAVRATCGIEPFLSCIVQHMRKERCGSCTVKVLPGPEGGLEAQKLLLGVEAPIEVRAQA